jgi:hypothetical protein
MDDNKEDMMSRVHFRCWFGFLALCGLAGCSAQSTKAVKTDAASKEATQKGDGRRGDVTSPGIIGADARSVITVGINAAPTVKRASLSTTSEPVNFAIAGFLIAERALLVPRPMTKAYLRFSGEVLGGMWLPGSDTLFYSSRPSTAKGRRTHYISVFASESAVRLAPQTAYVSRYRNYVGPSPDWHLAYDSCLSWADSSRAKLRENKEKICKNAAGYDGPDAFIAAMPVPLQEKHWKNEAELVGCATAIIAENATRVKTLASIIRTIVFRNSVKTFGDDGAIRYYDEEGFSANFTDTVNLLRELDVRLPYGLTNPHLPSYCKR